MLYKYTVWDKFEGKVTGTVLASDIDAAEEEALIAAAERGCSYVEDVELFSLHDA